MQETRPVNIDSGRDSLHSTSAYGQVMISRCKISRLNRAASADVNFRVRSIKFIGPYTRAYEYRNIA